MGFSDEPSDGRSQKMNYQIENELPITEEQMAEIGGVWYYVDFADSDDSWVTQDRQRAERFQVEETCEIETPDVYGDYVTLTSVTFDADGEVAEETLLRKLPLPSKR
jgi:hypothetical protein